MKHFLVLLFAGLCFACHSPQAEKQIDLTGENSGDNDVLIESAGASDFNYHLAFYKEFGEYTYSWQLDTIRNTISVITDSVNLLAFNRAMYESAMQFQNAYDDGNSNLFSHYFLNRFCLANDSFSSCADSVFQQYSNPLIVSYFPNSVFLDTNTAESMKSFPAGYYDHSPSLFHEPNVSPDSLKIISKLLNDTVINIFTDTLVDLNRNGRYERLIIYSNTKAECKLVIFAGQNEKRVLNLFSYYSKYLRFSMASLHGYKKQAIVIQYLCQSFVPREHYFEEVLIYVPDK